MADQLHPRRWALKRCNARCELCGRECDWMRLEVREDADGSLFCCPEHALPGDVVHPIHPEIHATLTSCRMHGAAANCNTKEKRCVSR